jgi:hypothetical protein
VKVWYKIIVSASQPESEDGNQRRSIIATLLVALKAKLTISDINRPKHYLIIVSEVLRGVQFDSVFSAN